MGSTWGRQDPGGPHVGPMDLTIWVGIGLVTCMNYILLYDLLLKDWLMGCAAYFICIDWWWKGWPMVACPFRHWVSCTGCCQYLLNNEMFNVWATVSTIVRLPGIFPPTDFPFENRMGLVSMDILYITFTYNTQDSQQECFRLSYWFPLRCLGAMGEPLSSCVMV